MARKKDKFTSFEYNPHGKNLCFTTNAPMCYDFDLLQFGFNQNPLGDPVLSKVYNIDISDTFNKIQFDTTYKDKHILLDNYNNSNTSLYKLFSKLHNQTFSVLENDLDRLVIFIEDDKIDQIQIFKRDYNNELLDSLNITREKDDLNIEFFRPYKCFKIEKIVVDGNYIKIRTIDYEYNYKIDTQPKILECVRELINETIRI